MKSKDKALKDFILVNRGLKKIGSSPKPTHGKLLVNGRVVYCNEPFALLQHKKKKLIESGVLSRKIEITY